MQISRALKLVFIAALIISDLVYVNVKVILDNDLAIIYCGLEWHYCVFSSYYIATSHMITVFDVLWQM